MNDFEETEKQGKKEVKEKEKSQSRTNPLSNKEIVSDLIDRHSKSLSEDLRFYLEQSQQQTIFEVKEVYPLLYDSLLKILIEQFDSFNIGERYSKEIESNRFNDNERRNYYISLYFNTLHEIIVYNN
jgi:hypothetical protein